MALLDEAILIQSDEKEDAVRLAIGAVSGVNFVPARNAVPEGGSCPGPARIERDYQVPSDRTIEYSTKALGWIPLGGIGGTQVLTRTEGELLDQLTRDRGLLGLKGFDDLRTEVFETPEARVPVPTSIPPHGDAQVMQLPIEEQEAVRAAWPTNDGHTDTTSR